MEEDKLKDVGIRLCRAMAEAHAHWGYFEAFFEYQSAYSNGSLIGVRKVLTSTVNAHLAAAASALYTLLDTSPSSYVTLKNYSKWMMESGNNELSSQIDRFFVRHKSDIKAITIFRHQHVAHRPLNIDEVGVFKLAGLEPGAMGQMIEGLSALYALISKDVKRGLLPPLEAARSDVSRLLTPFIEKQVGRELALDKLHT